MKIAGKFICRESLNAAGGLSMALPLGAWGVSLRLIFIYSERQFVKINLKNYKYGWIEFDEPLAWKMLISYFELAG